MHSFEEKKMAICKNPNCEIEFAPKDGRQVYCTRKCQIRWNNTQAREVRTKHKPITKALRTNKKILSQILDGSEEKQVSRDFLLGAGFNFTIFSFQKKVAEKVYAGIYDFGISKIGPKLYSIIKF